MNTRSKPLLALLAVVALTCSGCSTLSSAYTSVTDTVSGWFSSDSSAKPSTPDNSKK